jgi:phosphate transport system permease protein
VVGAGGIAAITSILAMLVFIFLEVVPLWRSPRVETQRTFRAAGGERLLAADSDEYGETLLGVSEAGVVRLVDAFEGRLVAEIPIQALEGQPPRLVTRTRDHVFALRPDGRLVGLRLGFDVVNEGARHRIEPRVAEVGTWQLPTGDGPVGLLAASVPAQGNLTVVLVPSGGTPHLFSVIETRNLFGAVHREEAYVELPLGVPGATTALAVNAGGTTAYIGSSQGYLQLWDLRDKESPRIVGMSDVTHDAGAPITVLGFVNGDRSLVVGDELGGVSLWFPVRDAAGPGGWRLQEAHRFRRHGAPVSAVAASSRDRSFLTGDAAGQVFLHHATTARTLVKFAAAGPVDALVYGKKGDAAFGLDAKGDVVLWRIVNPHPEVTLRTLFGMVWYEGYEAPSYTWQSTGATDDFEPKLSLIPLMFGTIKGTLYALLFAVPLAVLAALYTAQFTHPRVRAVVKPTVEIMAALPSVVLGFMAGLWLAPALESRLPGVLLMLIVVPVMLSGFGMAWYTVPRALRSRVGPTYELVIMMLVVVCVAGACWWANDPLERWLFNGDFRVWLRDTAGLRFDQRNCIVVGFAMGFAVIPIIFTISEDALASVPQSLASASLALGATRWQTALRVVLPTASPGIFSAIMIGFGRAIGETMIVLMATGNTPILEWNVFTGMRTLSANIAVEIPEAPYAGTLYRVLFLSALLLFTATFVVNTAAEIVRGRLRRRYQQL